MVDKHLSIITINYNNLEGLRRTIGSVCAQTWVDYEWIIIDGGSTDGSRELIEKTASECLNVSYWCSEPDKGVYNAQNKGICHARGEYLNFMNSGDTFYDKDVLKHVFEKERTADIVYGDWLWCENNKEWLAVNTNNPTMAWFQVANICHQAMFIKLDVLKNDLFDESYKLYADWAKWMKYAWEDKSFEYLPYVICRYELGGLSGSNLALAEEEKKNLQMIPPQSVQKALFEYEKCKRVLDRYEFFKFNPEALSLMEERPLYRRFFRVCTIIVRVLKKGVDFFHL